MNSDTRCGPWSYSLSASGLHIRKTQEECRRITLDLRTHRLRSGLAESREVDRFSPPRTCGQGARKSAAKTALFRAPLALTVSIDLSASGGEQGEVSSCAPGLRPPPGKQAAPGRLRCEYEIRIQMVGRGSTLVLDDFEAILSI